MMKCCMTCLVLGATLTATAGAYRTHLKGSLIRERLDAPSARQLKVLGLDGVEMNLMNLKELPTVDEAREVHAVAEREGLTICSVISGWFAFNERDRYDAELAKAKRCVELTAAYGAPIMLLVPVGFYPENGPKPPPYRDVAYSWDPVTLAVSAVVKGDNAPYAEFIRRQNEATAAAVRAVRELIPLAAEKGVIIALENVGSRMWMKPDFHHALVRSFRSPWVKFYFDLGNSLNVGDPCAWMDEFGADIVKVHLKDDVLDATRPWGQRQVAIGTGELDFRRLRDGLEKINYNGWVTVESDFGSDAEHAFALKGFISGGPVRAAQ